MSNLDVGIENDFVPSFNIAKPDKVKKKEFVDSEEPQVLIFQGMRGSGKGVAVDNTLEKLYKDGLTILHIWGARSLENLFWSVNLNCEEKYAKMKFIVDRFFRSGEGKLRERCMNHEDSPFNVSVFEKECEEEYERYLELVVESGLIKKAEDPNWEWQITESGTALHDGNLLHCKCHKAYPIILVVPDYIEFEQDTLDRFNGVYWKNLEEYKKYRIDINAEDKKLLEEGKLKKPEFHRPKALIVVKKFVPPTTANRKEKFREFFTDIVLQARQEKRIVVMNPALFEVEQEKFESLAEIIKMMKFLMNTSGHFRPLTEAEVGKKRKYWTNQQKSWHKICIAINEVRSVAPSNSLSGEKKAGISKRAVFDFIPEARHYKAWAVFDLQSDTDLYSGIRHQANLFIIKRGSKNILGESWSWLFDKIKKDQMGLVRSRGFDIDKYEHIFYHFKQNPELEKFVLDRRPLPDQLPANKGYVVYPDNTIKLTNFNLPSFHHKTSLQDFSQLTGIRWSISMNKEKEELVEDVSKIESIKNKKKIKEEIMQKIHFMKSKEKKSFKEIREELIAMEKNGSIPTMDYESKSSVYFNNQYLQWKKKNTNPIAEVVEEKA